MSFWYLVLDTHFMLETSLTLLKTHTVEFPPWLWHRIEPCQEWVQVSVLVQKSYNSIVDGLVQLRRNSCTWALDLSFSCANKIELCQEYAYHFAGAKEA